MRKENPEIKESEIEAPWLFLAGPFFLLCTLAMATWPNDSMNLYWLFVVLIGMTLCTCYKLRGCIFAIILLGLVSAVKHGFFITDHFWQLGLESSLACGLLITTLTIDQRKSMVQCLQETATIRGSTINNLEEELAKLREISQSQQIFLQEKLVETQKEKEDLQSELSSILILNEVLRKTTARQIEESEQLAEGSLDKQRRIGFLLDEIDALQKELTRVNDSSSMVKENSQLLDELNYARADQEQTHQINEMLARLHAAEAQKAKEASETCHALHAEKQAMQEQLEGVQAEVQMMSVHLQQVSDELARTWEVSKKCEALQQEKRFLQERLQTAELELHSASQKMTASIERSSVQEKAEKEALLDKLTMQKSLLDGMEERLKNVVQTERLYKQLKEQFEERNTVLHEARKKLFQAETQLQQLLIEKEQLTLEEKPISEEQGKEIISLEQEISDLREENDQLQQIITSLSSLESQPLEKKK